MTHRDPDRFFKIDHLQASMRARTARGSAITAFGQAVQFVLQILSTVVLARMLSPEEYGVFGKVIALTGFVVYFRDLGLSTATIQRPQLTHAEVTNMFWINVGVAVVFGVLFASLSPVFGWFYNDPHVVAISIVMAAGFPIGGLTVQHMSLLRRQMRFGATARLQMTAMFASVTAAIVAAWLGAGYWSLVVLQLVREATFMVGCWTLSGWIPGLPFWNTNVRPLVALGGHMTVCSIFEYFVLNIDSVLIGRFHGSEAVGLYSQARRLLLMPLQQVLSPLQAVALPSLSRLSHEPERLNRGFHQFNAGVILLMTPLVAGMVACADSLMLTIMGPQWEGTIPIFVAFGLGTLMMPVTGIFTWPYIATARGRALMVATAVVNVLHVICIAIGVAWGPLGVAIGFTVGLAFIRVPYFAWALGRDLSVDGWRAFRDVLGFTVVGLLTVGGFVGVRFLFDLWPGVITIAAPAQGDESATTRQIVPLAHQLILAAGMIAIPLLYLALLRCWPRGWAVFRESFEVLKLVRRPRAAAAPADGQPASPDTAS